MFAWWSSRPFWDKAEFLFAALTAASGASTASLAAFASIRPGWRIASAWLTFVFAFAVTCCKWRARVLDDRQRAAQAAETRGLRERAAFLTHRNVRRILEALRREFFQGRADEAEQPRATLFEATAEAELGKRLCRYARAGAYQDSDRSWALDDNELTGCRGIAGRAWFRRTTVSVTASCDWPADGDPAQKEAYANSLGMTVAEAESLNVKSRTFLAAPVYVSGERWGVLVLDCRANLPMPESPTSSLRRLVNMAAEAIGGILREAEL